jgi:hypothetical protein
MNYFILTLTILALTACGDEDITDTGTATDTSVSE